MFKNILTFLVFTLWGLIFLGNAKADDLFCAGVKSHQYNTFNNTLTVKLKKAIYTVEGKKTDTIDVLTTNHKLKIKIAATRENTELCFENLSFNTAKLLNNHLSEAANKPVQLYRNPLPDKVEVVHKLPKLAKYSL